MGGTNPFRGGRPSPWEQRSRSSAGSGGSDGSLYELQSTVSALRSRYLEDFLLLKPWTPVNGLGLKCRHLGSLAPLTPLADHRKRHLSNSRRPTWPPTM